MQTKIVSDHLCVFPVRPALGSFIRGFIVEHILEVHSESAKRLSVCFVVKP